MGDKGGVGGAGGGGAGGGGAGGGSAQVLTAREGGAREGAARRSLGVASAIDTNRRVTVSTAPAGEQLFGFRLSNGARMTLDRAAMAEVRRQVNAGAERVIIRAGRRSVALRNGPRLRSSTRTAFQQANAARLAARAPGVAAARARLRRGAGG